MLREPDALDRACSSAAVGGLLPLPVGLRGRFRETTSAFVEVAGTPGGVVVRPSWAGLRRRLGLVLGWAVLVMSVVIFLVVRLPPPGRGPGTPMLVLIVLTAAATTAMIGALVWAGDSKRMGGGPLVVERRAEGRIDLPRLGATIPAASLRAVTTVRGRVSDGGRTAPVTQLLVEFTRDDGVPMSVLVGSSLDEIPPRFKRQAARLAALLGVPHVHTEVRTVMPVEQLFTVGGAGVRSGADAARA